MLASIQAEFEKESISFFTVKGLDVAAFYPVPALRTMGDCDMIVHSVDKQRAHEALLKLGFMNKSKQNAEWTYYKSRLEFELHDHLLYDETVNSRLSKDFTETAWEYTSGDACRKTLNWNFHFIFLLLHLKKHLMNSGVGFRQFMDLMFTAKTVDLDWKWLTEQLQKLKILNFTRVCLTLCEQWFGVPLPMTTELDSDFYE